MVYSSSIHSFSQEHTSKSNIQDSAILEIYSKENFFKKNEKLSQKVYINED